MKAQPLQTMKSCLLMTGCLLCQACATSGLQSGTASHDPAGLIERILAGNIDQKGSRAYNRWGQGLAEGIAASDRKFTLPRQ